MTTQAQMFWVYENGRFVRVEWRFVDQEIKESGPVEEDISQAA